MGTADSRTTVTKIQKHRHVSWTNVQDPTAAVFSELEADYHLHPVHLNESIQKIELTGVEREADYLFLLLHIPVQDEFRDKLNVHQIGIFLGKDYLITIHDGPCLLISDLFQLFEDSDEHKQAYATKGPGYLLYGIVKTMLEQLNDTTQIVLNELDEIEDLVFDNSASDAYRIGKVRQKIIKLRRVVGSLRLVLHDLHQQANTFNGDHMSKYYSNNTKTANKLWEIIEEAEETVEIYKDADFTTSTERTNRILAVLTLVFTLTIPTTVVGTLYGMNVRLPGGIESGPWTFFGQYTTFGVVFGASLVVAVAMFMYFRSKKWF